MDPVSPQTILTQFDSGLRGVVDSCAFPWPLELGQHSKEFCVQRAQKGGVGDGASEDRKPHTLVNAADDKGPGGMDLNENGWQLRFSSHSIF